MSTSKRFVEIARLHALLHYGRTVEYIPGNHPILAGPSQNPFSLRNPLGLHTSLVPELADRWADRCGRANEHWRERTVPWPAQYGLADEHIFCALDFGWYWHHAFNASKHQAARLAAHPQCDDDEAERIRDERLKVENSGIRKNFALIPRSQPCQYDGHVKRLLSGHCPPPVDPDLSCPNVQPNA